MNTEDPGERGEEGVEGVPKPRSTGRAAASRWAVALLAVHATLLGTSLSRNAVTIDEVVHLPAGISYWHFGEFWCYHHNPPLIRLLFALPAVLADVPVDYRHYRYTPGSRSPDSDLGRDFMMLNRRHYLDIYVLCRAVVSLLSVLGGYLVFRWSREIFGGAGGLISLSLWCFYPDVLAHAGLVTPDIGSTVVGLLASYGLWRYLRHPTLAGAAGLGLLIGLAQASKFSMVAFAAAWAILFAVAAAAAIGLGRASGHAATMLLVSLLGLNSIYLFEGVGKPIGSFEFRSRLLTNEGAPRSDVPSGPPLRVNRFRGTHLARLPVPLPEHYVLGFDDQSYDVDSSENYKYLRGELREKRPGWYHYYAYALAVKSPLATLAILGLAAAAAIASRRCRAELLTEWSLLLPAMILFALVSSQRGLNSHVRYMLPIVPFVCISAGRLGRFVEAKGRWAMAGLAIALAANAASVVAVHPNYLTYFNEAAGGPDGGIDHLADSNIDWGQGLVALRDWLDRNAPGRPIRLAYFGTMFPEVLGIAYEVPPIGAAGPVADLPDLLASRHVGPAPGLQAVSANYLLGIPFPVPNGQGTQSAVPAHGYTYYREFRPIAIAGHSIFIYDIKPEEANRVRRRLGLPAWSGADPSVIPSPERAKGADGDHIH